MSQRELVASTHSWVDPWRRANEGFYRHWDPEFEFRTSIGQDTHVARALARLIEDEYLRRGSAHFLVVDVGCGSGRLLQQLTELIPEEIRLIGVDQRERPDELDARIDWSTVLIDDATGEITGEDGLHPGVVIAHEFLDDVPCTVVELDEALRPRLVMVDDVTGAEVIGPPLADRAASRIVGEDTAPHLRWLDDWWPATRKLARREIGLERARVWDRLRRVVNGGRAVAIDYAHRRPDRAAGLWDAGTLRGFRGGRATRAVPDGSVNITAHVALDALAGSPNARIRTQAQVLQGNTLASWPNGLGSYDWLIEPIVER